MALMRRLASIVPPPGNHDTSYFGVFASHSAWRGQIVKPRRKAPEHCPTHPGLEPPHEELSAAADPLDLLAGRDNFTSDASVSEQPYIPRALLLKRSFGIDVTRFDCGAPLRLKAVIEDPDRVLKELHRLGLWSEPPTIAKAKPSAQHEAFDRTSACDDVDPPAPDCVASHVPHHEPIHPPSLPALTAAKVLLHPPSYPLLRLLSQLASPRAGRSWTMTAA